VNSDPAHRVTFDVVRDAEELPQAGGDSARGAGVDPLGRSVMFEIAVAAGVVEFQVIVRDGIAVATELGAEHGDHGSVFAAAHPATVPERRPRTLNPSRYATDTSGLGAARGR